MVVVALLAGSAGAESPSAILRRLIDDREVWLLEQYPELGMSMGIYAHADRITDHSVTAIMARHERDVLDLSRLRAIDPRELGPADRLDAAILERLLRDAIDGHGFRRFLAPVGGRFGPQQQIPQMHERVRFASERDYRHYLTRLEQVPRWLDHIVERMRQGIVEQRLPPRLTVSAVPGQLQALLDGDLLVLGQPLQEATRLPQESRRELEDRFDTRTLPALQTALVAFQRFIVEEYVPRCPDDIAASAWPDGAAYYAHRLRHFTTTDLNAMEIHQLGLAEVARIRDEMLTVIRRSDFMTLTPGAAGLDDDALLRRFIGYLRSDPRFYHRSDEELLSGYRDICKRVDACLPKFFGTLPRQPYGVRAIPDFMAPNQTTAYYSPGDLRNAEPGYFYANTFALDQRPRYEMIALAMHEAVPGHHLQIALAMELPDVPEFRRRAGFTAFVEGWALYSERLGLEMALYDDPYDDFGRLLYEMWRACRLVVDPGMHALGWPRQQAIDYMMAHTALSELNVRNEIDRYIAWPGQATAYKIGELRLRDLRREAEAALGERFDIRAFHDVVLGAGAIPLDVLDERVRTWIGSGLGARACGRLR